MGASVSSTDCNTASTPTNVSGAWWSWFLTDSIWDIMMQLGVAACNEEAEALAEEA